MSGLGAFRDHCRMMAAAKHKPECVGEKPGIFHPISAPAECKCIFCGGIPLHMQRAETCTCSHLPTDGADGAK